jgi:hypothetical protein
MATGSGGGGHGLPAELRLNQVCSVSRSIEAEDASGAHCLSRSTEVEEASAGVAAVVRQKRWWKKCGAVVEEILPSCGTKKEAATMAGKNEVGPSGVYFFSLYI